MSTYAHFVCTCLSNTTSTHLVAKKLVVQNTSQTKKKSPNAPYNKDALFLLLFNQFSDGDNKLLQTVLTEGAHTCMTYARGGGGGGNS